MVSVLDNLKDTTKIEDQLLEISSQRNNLQEQLAKFLSEPHSNYQKLTSMQEILFELRNRVKSTADELNESIAKLDQWIDFWSKEEKNLGNRLTVLGPSSSLPVVQKEFDRLRNTIITSQETLNTELLPLMEVQRTAGRMQVSIYKLHLQMQTLFKNTFQHEIYKHAPLLFSSDYLDQ